MTRFFGETLIAMVWSVGAVVSGLVLLWGHVWIAAGMALLALGLVLTFMSLSATRVMAGADGLAIRWLGRTRFIPYDDMASLEPHTRFKNTGGLFPQKQEVSRGVLIRHNDGSETYL